MMEVKTVKTREDRRENPTKKQKVDNNENAGNSPLTTFQGFQLKRMLNEDASHKMVCALGSFDHMPGEAVILLNKTAFDDKQLPEILSKETSLKQIMQNDVYGVNVTLIHPATQRHIDKYAAQPMYLIEETPDDYEKITLPFINKEQLSITWVDNIFEHKAETDRIIYEDTDPETGFVLLPDIKWNQKQNSDLYLIAIAKPRILSIRELTANHLSLLENIDKTTKNIIREKFGLSANQLRVYFHYQPSYYHLHVHFTHLNFEAPGTTCDKAHLLTVVAENLRKDSMYYKNAIIPFRVREDFQLFKLFKAAGRID